MAWPKDKKWDPEKISRRSETIRRKTQERAAVVLASGEKRCPKCETVQKLDNFSKLTVSPDGHNVYCRSCQNTKNQKCWGRYYEKAKNRLAADDKEMYRERYAFIAELKSKPCMDCGLKYPPCVMDFDHARGEKRMLLCKIGGSNWNRVLEEIKKCDVICSNCHRIRTYERKNNSDE